MTNETLLNLFENEGELWVISNLASHFQTKQVPEFDSSAREYLLHEAERLVEAIKDHPVNK